MAIVQGKPFTFSITPDATKYPTLTGVKAEVFLNDSVVIKFSYPAADGYTTMTVLGGVYTAVIPSETTATMRGLYGIEVLLYENTTLLDKAKNNNLVVVNKEAT